MWFLSNKVLVRESGLLEGFCDFHSHLLPGVDDGVEEASETLQILREWEALGVSEVWLTPHIMEDMPNMPGDLKARFEELLKVYSGGIRLHLAAEHMMDGPFMKRLEDGDVLPFNLNDNLYLNANPNLNKRLLVETSYYTPPMNMDEIVNRVKSKGYEPILAHPERYQYMDKSDYKRWRQNGVLLQVNLPSLVGAYGPDVRRKAEWLLKENMYDLCGTDTHSMEQVEFFLDETISKKTVKKVRNIMAISPSCPPH